jgi:hypothetical protein
MKTADESAMSGGFVVKDPVDCDLGLVKRITRKLLQYCADSNWAGYDPYDALNSRILQKLPFLDSKWVRLTLVQGLKRSPVNLRPLLLVPKTQNAKGLALFLSALVKLLRARLIENENEPNRVADLLLKLRTRDTPYFSWGYSFDWQTRTELVPRGSPNVICTTFAANALLDAYESRGRSQYCEAALKAAQFVLERLYCSDGEAFACFNYTPLERTQIHNANLLAAALLCRVSNSTGEQKFLIPALKAARFSAAKQNKDASWYYGERERPSQKWIDNFHTGFNLCALQTIGRFAHTNEFEPNVIRGLDYYRSHFFEPDGAPRYFHNRKYPVDIHSAAQSIITLLALNDLNPDNINLAHKVLCWTIEHMWDKRGYFYYQQHRFWKNCIPYLRWAQAWMLLALATFLEATFNGLAMPATTAGAASKE